MTRQTQSRLTLTYINIRKIIGILAMSLPIVIFLAEIVFFRDGLQTSISAYYYTGMRWFFVLTLCCIGFFLLFYQGYDDGDKRLARIAGLAAFSTALFPTSPSVSNVCASPLVTLLPNGEAGPLVGSLICQITDKVHLVSAATMFLTVAYFSLFRFTKGESESKEKKARNRVYRTCGWIILAAIAATALSGLWEDHFSHTVYWGEFVALVAFGVSWAVKGEVLWMDAVPPVNSANFNVLQSRQYQGYKSGLPFFVFLVALWFTVTLYDAKVPPFNLFEVEKAASSEQVVTPSLDGGGEGGATEAVTNEAQFLGFEKTEAQNILMAILFALVVIVFYLILNHQVLSLFWPLVRRNFRVDIGNDASGERENLWSLFSNEVNELGVQPRFSINPRAESAISAPPTLTPDSSYLKTFFDLVNWIFPRLGYNLRLNKLSSKNSGTGLSLAVARNDRKENIAEKIFWAGIFGIEEEKDADQGSDLKVQQLLMIPAYYWFEDIVDGMDGFDPEPHAWESMAYYQLGNSLWHSDLDKGINCYSNSINLDQKNWPAYAALGRVWIEKSQEQAKKNSEIAVEYLLLASSYLSTAIEGLKQNDQAQDQVYFGAMYNQIVALNYLLQLGWSKQGFGLEDLEWRGNRVKKEAMSALIKIQAELIRSERQGFLDDVKTAAQKALPFLFKNQGRNDADNERNLQCETLKSHLLANWLILFLPTLEFVLQGLETQKNGFDKEGIDTWLEGVMKRFADLPCFEDPINMDQPLKDSIGIGYHFTRSHYRVQYNAACFYSQLASVALKKDRKKFFDLSLDHLAMSLSAGGGLVAFARKDTSLDAIRNHPRYREIMKDKKKETEKSNQPGKENRSVYRRDDGKWVHKRHGTRRASRGYDTQAEAVEEARKLLRKQGGGELIVHGEDGRIRQKDTIAPAKDPRDIQG